MAIIHVPIFEIKNGVFVKSSGGGGEIIDPPVDHTPILVKASNPDKTPLSNISSAKWYFSDGVKYQTEFRDYGMGVLQWGIGGNVMEDNYKGAESLVFSGFPILNSDNYIWGYRLYIPEHYEDPITHEWVNGNWGGWTLLGEVEQNDLELTDNMKYENGSLFIRYWVQSGDITEPVEPTKCVIKNKMSYLFKLQDSEGNKIFTAAGQSNELTAGTYKLVDCPVSGIKVVDEKSYQNEKFYQVNDSIQLTEGSFQITQSVYQIPEGTFDKIDRDNPIPPEHVDPDIDQPIEQPEHDEYYDPNFPYKDNTVLKLLVWADNIRTFTFDILTLFEGETATIDWGDGETTVLTEQNNTQISHTYENNGVYDVVIDNKIQIICVTENNLASRDMLFEVVQLGDAIENLSNGCFRGANRITHIELPMGLKYIGPAAFTGCRSLKEITVKSMTAPIWLDRSAFNTECGSDVVYKKDMKLTIPWYSTGYEEEGSLWISVLVEQCGYKLEHDSFSRYVDLKKLEEKMIRDDSITGNGIFTGIDPIPMTVMPCADDIKFPDPDYELDGIDCVYEDED